MSEEQVNKLVDIWFYKGVRDIVKDYLFIECVECDKKVLEENSLRYFDGRDICNECIMYRCIRICKTCDRYYNIEESINDCEICAKSCLVDCDECYYKQNLQYLYYDTRHLNIYWTNTYPEQYRSH